MNEFIRKCVEVVLLLYRQKWISTEEAVKILTKLAGYNNSEGAAYEENTDESYMQ